MFGKHDKRIEALMEQITAARREAARREGHRRIKQLQGEVEKSLPADVPLHRRGFGVMDDPP